MAREMLYGAEWVGSLLVQCTTNLSSFVVFHNTAYEKRFDGLMQDLCNEMEALEILTARESGLKESVEELGRQVSRVREILLRTRGSLLFPGMGDPEENRLLTRQIKNGTFGVAESIDRLTVKIKESRQFYERLEGSRRKVMQNCLLMGIALNILMGVILSFYFGRDISQRLAVIVGNTSRLLGGEPLAAPVGGSDEIAHLDGVFHRMAEELAEAQRKERALTDNALDVILSVGGDLAVQKVNRAGERLWQLPAKEIVGRSLAELVHPDESGVIAARVEALRGAESPSETLELRGRGGGGAGTYFMVSVHWSEVDEAYFCVFHDVSERHRLEQMRRDFVNMISHDLRTPLTAVGVFFEVLRAGGYGDLNQKGAKSADNVKQSLDGLIRLVNDLLDVEKMESGMMSISPEELRLEEVVEAAIESVRAVAAKKGVEIASDTAGETIVRADRLRMIQVVQNLLSNAVRFSPEGKRVTVGMNADASRHEAEVSVRDEGPGIAEGDQEMIFERFRQVAGKEAGGTGLGLAICKAIVESPGGTIGVKSRIGQGSLFWFRIPAQQRGDTVAFLEPEPATKGDESRSPV